ncbi:hypothetical protein IT774_05140 [Salinimonas marina]|uniref:Uncharacterized protein n=1 Tax=Salinimonas marina TaxID=2785918 RepID=A0A7S9HDV4_9ALTE|nr:hypothetical protein [Salinimonas marina]QPG06559.1 hypothetical protein IT774_05140 [Salinimonas marina]
MNYSDIENHLATLTHKGQTLFRQVITAVDQETVIANGLVRQDTAFVVPMSEQGNGEFIYTTAADQTVVVAFGVIVAVRALNDPLGRNVNERLQTIYRTVRRNLIGWTPDPSTDEIAFVEGELITFGQGGAFWMETYTTSYRETTE